MSALKITILTSIFSKPRSSELNLDVPQHVPQPKKNPSLTRLKSGKIVVEDTHPSFIAEENESPEEVPAISEEAQQEDQIAPVCRRPRGGFVPAVRTLSLPTVSSKQPSSIVVHGAWGKRRGCGPSHDVREVKNGATKSASFPSLKSKSATVPQILRCGSLPQSVPPVRTVPKLELPKAYQSPTRRHRAPPLRRPLSFPMKMDKLQKNQPQRRSFPKQRATEKRKSRESSPNRMRKRTSRQTKGRDRNFSQAIMEKSLIDVVWIDGLPHPLRKMPADISQSGAYWVVGTNGRSRVGVFKPVKMQISSPRTGVDYPSAHLKEVAAYKLDPESVPKTILTYASIHNDKKVLGSFQRYVNNIGNAESQSESRFSENSVHRIAILDIRMFNTDRNLLNLLIQAPRKGNGTGANFGTGANGCHALVPVDHELSIPRWTELQDFDEVCWLLWKKASTPFSDEEMNYISTLDARGDYVMLKGLGIKPEEAFTCYLMTTFLKICVANGFTAAQIGDVISHNYNYDEPSTLEKLRDKSLSDTGVSAESLDVCDVTTQQTRTFMKNFTRNVFSYCVDKNKNP